MSNLPQLSWEQTRVLQYVMEKKMIPEVPESLRNLSRLHTDLEERRQARGRYFQEFGLMFATLGTLPGELRGTIEPLHPLTNNEQETWLTEHLRTSGVADPSQHAGLVPLSRALFTSYGLGYHMLFENAGVPADHDDLFLYDPLAGFLLFTSEGRRRNFWLGNQRDLLEVQQMPQPVNQLLIESHADHFCLGRSLFTRLIGHFMTARRYYELDDADIPTMQVESQADLDALADDLKAACERAPLPIEVLFRGQSSGHRLPDRTALVDAGITLYSDVRDYSLVPSLFRKYDEFIDDLEQFRSFVSMLHDWAFCSDLVFGDPAQYLTLDGRPYTPIPVPPTATATMALHAGGLGSRMRAVDDISPYTVWTITGEDGTVLDRYQKAHRPGHDSARRNLILQHYGAPTSFLDVTTSIRVAEWFALNRLQIGSDGLAVAGAAQPPHADPVIFVFLVLHGLAPVVHTSSLVSADEALRPHRQECAVLGGAGNLYRNAATRFIALKIKFGSGFQPSGLPTARQLFPGPDEDNALKKLLHHYEKRVIKDDKLRNTFPVYWFAEDSVS